MAEKASQRASCVSASSSDCNSCFAAWTGSRSSATRASNVVNAARKSRGSSDRANVAEASPTSMPTSGNLPVDLRKSNSLSWRSAWSFLRTPDADAAPRTEQADGLFVEPHVLINFALQGRDFLEQFQQLFFSSRQRQFRDRFFKRDFFDADGIL